MKNYNQLGELLTDYRLFNNISQAEFAAAMNVDARTVIRWEMNQSLLKPEKEKELALKYGYGVFICRPVDLKAIRFQYLQDEYASLKIDFCCNSAEEFFQSPDILSIAEWIKSGEEDYFVLGK